MSFTTAGAAFRAATMSQSFLCGQLHIFQSYHPRASKADLSRILVALIAPLLGAALIAISRCEDYRHDVWDVTTGSALGLLVAWGVYRRFYPPLSSRPISNTPPSPSPVFTLSCDTPYPVMGMGPEGRWNSRGGGGNGYVGGGEYGGEGFGYSRPADAEDGGFPEMENGTSRGEAVPLREMDRRRSDVGNMV
ncbi:MAG: hypothetical protein M4579_002245 [Chaenotheca gracillima]|nr:MAG: hypothetical protein M4579_002245 [Chaenotheca gracillima]